MSRRIDALARHVALTTTATSSSSSSTTTSYKPPTPVALPADVKPVEAVRHMSLRDLQERYGHGRPHGVQLHGSNHIAWVSSDMARTVWFWCEVLGCRLTKTIELPDGGQHFFIEGGNNLQIAYFYFGKQAKPGVKGVSIIDIERMFQTGEFPTSHGSVNHVAFNVSRDKLLEYRKLVRSANVGYVGPIMYHSDVDPSGYSPKRDEHTTWESFYFVGPDGEHLEFTAATDRPFTPERDIRHTPAFDKSSG